MSDPIMNESGFTELHLAAYHGELDWVQNCLAGGLQVDARDKGGHTPLWWAADMGVVVGDREEIVKTLLAAGADVNARSDDGDTILRIAIDAGNMEIVDLLIAAGADVDAKSSDGESLLEMAIRGNEGNCKRAVEVLVGAGANVHASTRSGKTLLEMALWEGNKYVIRRLKKAGA